MANTNPGGLNLNVSPYYDDYDEDKKFVRILYRPGRAVQARELTQAQTITQSQIKRFAEYFFKHGTIVDGCEQSLDLNLNFVKLQSTFNSSDVDVADFEGQIVFGANTGIKAYAGLVADIEGNDPKTLFINYLSTGSIALTVNNASTTLTPGNTITFSTGNTATIETTYVDPIGGTNIIFVSNNVGTLTVSTANTIDSTGATIPLNVTAVADNRGSNNFANSETIFTANVSSRSYASSATTYATKNVVNLGLATEKVYDKGSKITISDGVVWMADHFVKHTSQTLVLDKYSNEPSYKIGLVPQKSFVDYIEDLSLVDNAQGTPNFQAPGADRLKIDTILTKVGLDEVTDENEFITLSEIESGVTRKRKQIDVESKLEDVLAKRTQEESGNYTITDPTISVVEHLNTGSNNGRYVSSDGGNTNLLVVDVDPFTSYVSGYRNQIISKTPVELEKGLTTQYVEQTKTQINYGNYTEVKELVGTWDLMESTKIDLYDTAQQVITNDLCSNATVTGTKIGDARVRSIEFVSGVKGTSSAIYRIYLYEIVMNAGKDFSQVRALYKAATPKRFADIVLDSSGNAKLQETSFDTMIFKLPYNAIKTIRDTSQNIESGFRFKKKFAVTFSGGVATVVTDLISETFVGNGTLNATQKEDHYMVIVNNAGANVETTALSGTLTISAGTKIVSGTSTSFTTQLNAGDFIKVGTGQIVKVTSISNNTYLTLEDNHTAGATANTFTKILPPGYVIPLASQGGTGASRTVDVSTGGTSVTVDVKENATFTADIIVSMDRANAREKRKILTYQAQANIQPNTHPTLLAGPYTLGYGDIYRLHAVYQSSSFLIPATTANTNVTQYFTLDNGQRDYAYEYGAITPVPGFTPSGRLLVVFDHFIHDVSQGVGYCSIDSYPINDTATSNTTITTSQIPKFTSPKTGAILDLRDCLDFRPIKTANTSLNPSDIGTYQIPNFGLRIPAPSSDFDADLIYYKGRIAKVYINSKGTFGINNGVPASAGNQIAESPPAKSDTLEIAELFVPPYPSQPKDVNIKLLKNRRFTMKDVGRINERLERIEYTTALSLLEKQATEKTELDSEGIERFKNGILVDTFTGHSVGSTLNPDWKAAINKTDKYASSWQINTDNSQLGYVSSTSTTTKTVGNKVLLPYTEVEAPGLKQPYASKQLRLAEELNFFWTGNMRIIPYVDNFFETQNDPERAIVYDDTGDAQNWQTLINAWNSQVAPLNQWLGTSVETSLVAGSGQTTNQGNFTVTTQLQRQTQEAFQYRAAATVGQQKEVSFNRVVKVETPFFMRQREFVIRADGLKDNARMYTYFDGINVTANCYQIRLLAGTTFEQLNDLFDNNGYLTQEGVKWEAIASGSAGQAFYTRNNEIILLFEVPLRKFYVGQREFKVTDSSTNSEGTTLTSARQSVFSQGIKQYTGDVTINSRPVNVSFTGKDNIVSLGRRVVREERVETGRVWNPPPQVSTDPLSQSFYVEPNEFPKGFYLTSIDLYFKNKSQNPNYNVRVELRELENGFPSPKFIGQGDEAIVNNKNINISETASLPTNFAFKNPIYLKPGNEYCFAIKPDGNDPDFAIWVAELGAIDITNPEKNTRIEQAYNAGVLFTSSNDRTWSPKQNIDIKFTMKIADFALTEKVAYWNNLPVSTAWEYDTITPGITDQVIPGTNIKYEIKMADSTYAVDDDFTEVKNYEGLLLKTRKQISNTTIETSQSFKSLQLRATLSTTNRYVSPYVDDESTVAYFSRNLINNSTSTSVTGTVTYASANNIVVGTGTTFTTQVFPGEYALFGNDQYRRIASVANNTYLIVNQNFTSANGVNQTISVRKEENPSGPYSSESRYITKVVTLNDGFEASDLSVYMNVNRPPGTSIKVYYKILNENDTDKFDQKFYTEMTLVGSETFTEDRNSYKEEKYIVPTSLKTGGSELLSGNVLISTSNTNVFGTSTRFIEDLKIGDTIAVGTARTQRIVSTIANNTFLTVESAFASTASSQEIYKILNNEVAYTTPDGRTFAGYKYFAIKIVFLSANPLYSPRIKDLRGIALA